MPPPTGGRPVGATEGMLGATGLGPNVGVPPLSDGAMPGLVAPG